MTDSTETATPEEIARFDQLVADRASGKIDDYAWQHTHAPEFEVLAPKVHNTPRLAPANAGDAQAKLDSLTQMRINGEISEREFRAEADKLGPVASGEAQVILSDAAAQELDAAMRAPDSPAGYEFDYGQPLTEEAQAVDADIRSALHELGIPQQVAGYAYQAVDRLLTQLENATDGQRRQHVESVLEALKGRWGDEYQTRMDGILDFVARAPGALGDLLEIQPWTIADPLLLSQIDALVQHGKNKQR